MSDETPTFSEEPQPPAHRRAPIGLIITVFLVLLLLGLSGSLRTDRSAAVQDTAMMDVMSGDMYLKLSYLLSSMRNSPETRKAKRSALNFYERAAEASPSPRALRRVGLLSEDRSGALTAFMKLSAPKTLRLVANIDRPSIKREVAMWKRVYSGARLSPAEARDHIRFLSEIDVGPARYIAQARIYQSAGMTKKAEAAKRTAVSRYSAHLVAAMVILLIGVFVALAGTVALIVMIAMPTAAKRFLRLSDRHDEDAPVERSLWLSFLAYLLIFIIASTVGSLIAGGAVEHLRGPQRVNYIVGAQFATHAATVIIALLILRKIIGLSGGSLRSVGLRSRKWIADIAWGIGGYAVALPVFGIGALLFMLMKMIWPQTPTPPNQVVPLLLYASAPAALVALFALASVVAPLLEETFFRGVLFRALRFRLGVWPGILISAAAFAMVHPLPAHFFPILGLGVSFAVLLQARESLAPCMVAHALHNGSMFVLAILVFRS